MAVYNLSGEELRAVYDVNGAEIDTAYDVTGAEIYTSIDPVTIDQVPETFQSVSVEAMEYVNGLSDDYANYIVLADTHYSANYGHSAKVANYLYSSGKFDKLIHVGDMLNDTNVGEADWQSMEAAGLLHFGGRWLFAQGNHDNHLSPLADAMAYFEPSNVHYTVSDYRNVYYYDNKKHGIRFIVIHHYMHSYNSSEVENWIKYRPSGYKWAIINHYPFNNGEWDEDMCLSADSYLYGLIESYGSFIGNFCGHLHLDSHDVLTSGTKDFHQMTFDTDGSGGRADDINGQVITIVSINPKTENVKFYRIGRSTVYGKQWEYTGFTE